MNDSQDARVYLFSCLSGGFGIEQPQHLTVPPVDLVVIGDKAELTASSFIPISSIRLLRICSTTYS